MRSRRASPWRRRRDATQSLKTNYITQAAKRLEEAQQSERDTAIAQETAQRAREAQATDLATAKEALASLELMVR